MRQLEESDQPLYGRRTRRFVIAPFGVRELGAFAPGYDARDRLIELIRRAAIAPIPRRATKPTAGSRERRLQSKKRRSSIKGLRQHKPGLE